MRRVRLLLVVLKVTSPEVVKLKPALIVRIVLLPLVSVTDVAAAFAVTVTVWPLLIVTVSPAAGEPPAPVQPAFHVVAVPPFQLPVAFDVQDPGHTNEAAKLRIRPMTTATRIRSTRTAVALPGCRWDRGNT